MKNEIIDIALRQLRLGGYDTLNFGHIATELSVTRANLHHHFKNKEGLALAAVQVYVDEEQRAFNLLIEAHAPDLPKFLSALEDHLISSIASQTPFTACVGSQLVRDSVAPKSLRALALQRFREEAQDIEDVVVSYFQGTATDVDQARKLAFRIVATMHGIDMMAQTARDAGQLRHHIKGTLTSILAED